MSVFDRVGTKITDTAKAAARKSGDIVEVARLYMSIGSEEEKIKKVHIDLGKIIYETYCNDGEVDEAFKDCCESIKTYEENIKEMKAKILDLKNLKQCSACKAEIDEEFAFCPKCGSKQ